jgi:hypothetical protein
MLKRFFAGADYGNDCRNLKKERFTPSPRSVIRKVFINLCRAKGQPQSPGKIFRSDKTDRRKKAPGRSLADRSAAQTGESDNLGKLRKMFSLLGFCGSCQL